MNLDQDSLSKDVVKEICEYKQISEEAVLKHGEFNHSVADVVFNYLEHKGINVTNVTSTYGYFLFYFYPNSVYYFNVKGLSKKWKFGMWINSNVNCYLNSNMCDDKFNEDNPFIEVFCQHEDNIDKFKPSCSDLLVQCSYKDFFNLLKTTDSYSFDWFIDRVVRMIKSIKRHPFLAFTGYVNPPYFLTDSPILYYINVKRANITEHVVRVLVRRYSLYKCCKLMNCKYVNSVRVSLNDEYSYYPSTSVYVELDSEVTDDQVETLVNKVFKHYPKCLDSFAYGSASICFNSGDKEYYC